MSYPEGIHPWTVNWFETLPHAYQLLDANQKNPALTTWDGLNEHPLDTTESGGWSTWVETPKATYKAQDFRSFPGIKIYYQIWIEPGTVSSGSFEVYASARDSEGYGGLIVLNGDTVVMNVTAPVLLEGWLYAPASGLFSVFFGGGAVLDDQQEAIPNSKVVVKAVNISTRKVTYEELSGIQQPQTFHPLLRYMDGIGQIGGQYRDLSDKMWDGYYTNPDTCPDESLRWLAQMAGLNRNVYRILPLADLRALIKTTKQNGLAALGSRTAIADIVRPYLSGEKLCLVGPHPYKEHTILIRVNFTEVPNNDLAALAANIRRTRVIPAGHVIEITEMLGSWNEWEAAAGSTWNDLESKVTKWGEQDTLGVTLT